MTTPISEPKEAKVSEPEQAQVTRVAVLAAQLMMEYGAQSGLSAHTAVRIGKALGMDRVDLAIHANGVTLTTLWNDYYITTARRLYDHGISMKMVCDVDRIMGMIEKGLLDAFQAEESLNALKRLRPPRYNRWLMIGMMGLCCGCFSRLFGGDGWTFLITMLAASVAMFIRQELAHRHHLNPLITYCVTAFVATCIASSASILQLGNHPELALAACVLLLVPGFPLVNAVSDIVQGYVNVGISRFMGASILMLITAVGIATALAVMGIRGYL